MEPVHSFCRAPLFRRDLQCVCGVNPLNDQHIAVLFDFSLYVGRQKAVACRYLARLQRAAECAGQSAACGRIDIIERGGVRLMDGGVHAVMFRHL